MDERGQGNLRKNAPCRSQSFTTLVTIGAGGLILLLGLVAAAFLTRATPGALVVTLRVLLTAGVVGLLVMTYLVAVHCPHPGRDHGGGPGRDQLRPIRPTVDPDAELVRILDDPRFGDLFVTRRGHLHDRRPATESKERVR